LKRISHSKKYIFTHQLTISAAFRKHSFSVLVYLVDFKNLFIKKIPFVQHDRSSEVFVVGVDLLAQFVDELEIRDKN
jgi:hypothetical protein